MCPSDLFKGKKDVSFKRGSSESAYVTHVTTGKMKLTDNNKAEMSAMLMVLNEKLRENIREKMSGVYMIQAWQQYEGHPHEHYTLSILLTCDPARTQELNEAIFATVDSLRAGEFGERYVSSSKAVLQKRYEESISQNRYWLSNMSNNAFGREKLDSFLEHPARYAKIDKKTITKAAKQYLRFDRDHLAVVMKPETQMQ